MERDSDRDRDRDIMSQWGSRSGAHTEGSDTIYALSSGPGRAAIAIIRISGPAANRVCSYSNSFCSFLSSFSFS